jgi:DNA polymerase I-like protein with 3'-5' exonuclease and polymerase domains
MYLLEELREPPHTNVIVGFGESVLAAMTGKRGIDKWNLSPLETKCGKKFIPTFGLDRVQKQYDLNLYQEMALRRAKEECGSRRYERPEERFLLNPPLEHTLSILSELLKKDEVACDVETGYGQINTVGFAWSPSDAIAINVLPGNYNDDDYYELWKRIGMVLESPSVGKVFQNYIYDTSYFSAYGIRTRNITHDTMHAMKVLWPEFKSNLGNVGRFYTKRPYWKDDGKVTDEEGAKKDWGNVRDWTRHYLYNCRDATGTFEAAVAQKQDLRDRGLSSFFRDYALRLTSPVREMCAGGMPLCLETKAKLKKETEETLERLTEAFQTATGSDLNPRSSKQVLGYLRENGVKIPKKYDKEKGSYRESADASSIKKIRLKQDLPGLAELQQIKSLDKALSAYIDFDVRPDGRLPYFLNITGTETLRFAGGKDGWERGFNIQTIPREGGDVSIKSMFKAPEGYSFIEVDLRQAESRFVAYDSADKSLIDMLESGADVHSHVGRAILRQMGKDPSVIPTDEFKSTWRQLGKKAGHGLNYYMKPRMFVETVFDELDMVISVKDAEAITQAYYGLFPGIPRWHAWIKHELYQKRKLSAPSGWERYFYGRWGDDMFKEAFAWKPQHTIPWIMNHLMLHLCEERKRGKLEFSLVYQGHDSLSLLSREGEVPKIAKTAASTWMWHPKVDLPGGRLCIPVEIKTGKCMADLAEFTS